MSHLGRWLSALVDSELDGSERDLVLNHLAGCDPCRSEANALRALKRRMRSLGDTAADTALTGRLIGLAQCEETLVCQVSGPGGWNRPMVLPGQRRGRLPRIGWRLAGTAVGIAAAAVSSAAFLLGGASAQPPLPRVTPAVDTYWLQHDYDAGVRPAARPGPASRVTARYRVLSGESP